MAKTVSESLAANVDLKKTISVPLKVSIETIQGLLISAFEGGSTYWNQIQEYKYPNGKTRDDFAFPHCEVPLCAGGAVLTMDIEELGDYKAAGPDQREKWTLTLEKCIKGLEIMAEKHPRHFADVLSENDDSITADVFLQCCLLGDIIYG